VYGEHENVSTLRMSFGAQYGFFNWKGNVLLTWPAVVIRRFPRIDNAVDGQTRLGLPTVTFYDSFFGEAHFLF
jgi:hypothetical protein